ncbi:hypothetical protein KSP39_PZI001101 [Platanthera zijinensis]|uniref:Uncharacterized protein n=1 Tax=Platanthera zijinensis TaxID=2320716 RepID=A0AAP0C356_9ASPA
MPPSPEKSFANFQLCCRNNSLSSRCNKDFYLFRCFVHLYHRFFQDPSSWTVFDRLRRFSKVPDFNFGLRGETLKDLPGV